MSQRTAQRDPYKIFLKFVEDNGHWSPGEHAGEMYFNVLEKIAPACAHAIRGTEYDASVAPQKIGAMLEFLREKFWPRPAPKPVQAVTEYMLGPGALENFLPRST
jgi:hypothetical protein